MNRTIIPHPKAALVHLDGLVEAPVPDVFHALCERAPHAAAGAELHVDRDLLRVEVLRGRWYRGVVDVAPHPQGARVRYRVFARVSAWWRWLAPFLLFNAGKTAYLELAELLRQIGAQIHRPSQPLHRAAGRRDPARSLWRKRTGGDLGRPVWSWAAVIEAPVDQVTDLALGTDHRLPAGVEVDRERGVAIAEGQWWYRGETSFAPHERGTLVTYRVYNVAATWRWAVPLILWQYRRSGQLQGIESGVRALGARLGCRVEPIAGV